MHLQQITVQNYKTSLSAFDKNKQPQFLFNIIYKMPTWMPQKEREDRERKIERGHRPADTTTCDSEGLYELVKEAEAKGEDVAKYFPSMHYDYWHDDTNHLMVMRCPSCGQIDYAKVHTPNKLWLEVLLYCLFIIPWIIYSVITRGIVKFSCRHCGYWDTLTRPAPNELYKKVKK